MTDLFTQYEQDYSRHISQAQRRLRSIDGYSGDSRRLEISAIERELQGAKMALDQMQTEASLALSNRGRLESRVQTLRKELQEQNNTLARAKNPSAAAASSSPGRGGSYGATSGYDPEVRARELSDRLGRVDQTMERTSARFDNAHMVSEENRQIGQEVLGVLVSDKERLYAIDGGASDIRDNMAVGNHFIGQMTWRMYQHKGILIGINVLLLAAMVVLLYFLITK